MKRGGKEQTYLRLRSLINRLHTTDCVIDDQILQDILSYGELAVPHLEAILRAAVQKSSQLDPRVPPKSTQWFVVVHALYLLAHLPSGESLDLILTFLAQKQPVLDYWLQDLLDEDMWEIPFLLGKNQLDKLETFVLDQNNNEFSRLAVCTALVQIALQDQSKRPAVREIFRTVLHQKKEEPDFLGLVVSELMDWRDEALNPAILAVLARNQVYEGIITAEEISLLYQRPHVRMRAVPDLLEKYAEFRQHAYFSKTAPSPEKITKQGKVQKTL
ncbi:MAG: DUF1186 domain-containing protein [bacterium]